MFYIVWTLHLEINARQEYAAKHSPSNSLSFFLTEDQLQSTLANEQARDVRHAGINRGCVGFARRRSDVGDDVSDISSCISWGLWRAALLQAVTAALGTVPCSEPRSSLRTSRWLTANLRNSGTISRGYPNIWRHRCPTTREYPRSGPAFGTDDTICDMIRTTAVTHIGRDKKDGGRESDREDFGRKIRNTNYEDQFRNSLETEKMYRESNLDCIWRNMKGVIM